MVRHKRIKEIANLIDAFVDRYRKINDRKTFPHMQVGTIVRMLFNSKPLGKGWHKSAHLVYSTKRNLVFKFGRKVAIRRDTNVYKRIPNRYYAKVYWFTKYCMLQKYGIKSKVSKSELKRLQKIGKQYGLGDIRPDNIRKVDGKLKIVDANLR